MKENNSRNEIVKRLLNEAGYYWSNEDESSQDLLRINEYDPVVEKLFQASAIELERLYADIDNSRQEIMQRLSQVILPEQYALPEPGFTVAQINPKFSRLEISAKDSFEIIGKSDTGSDYNFFFTTLFDHNLPKCDLIYTLTDAFLINVNENLTIEIPRGNRASPFENTNFLWLGLDINTLNPEDQITFFLGNKLRDTFDKNNIVFHQAKWFINGDCQYPCEVLTGLQHFKGAKESSDVPLTEKFNIPTDYIKKIIHRFQDSFLTINKISTPIEAFKRNSPPGFEQIPELTKPLLWIKLKFDLPLPNVFLKENRLYPNSIPLVNRKLKEEHLVKRDFNRLLLPLPTDYLFLEMESVKDEKSEYKLLDNLSHKEQQGTYMVRRSKSVRRINSKDVLTQIHDLLDLIYEEKNSFREQGVNRLIQDFKFIDEAIDRIRKSHANGSYDLSQNTDYYAIATVRKDAYRVTCNYWECQGELINRLGNRIDLEVKSGDISIADSYTLIPLQPGRNNLKEEDYINLLKSSILSRDKIVTRGDIELFCLTNYQDTVNRVAISHKIMSSKKNPSIREKVVLVTLTLKKQLEQRELDFLKGKIQNDLNIRASFFTPIIIQFHNHDG